MGLIADAFGPPATTARDLLTKVPEGWSLKQAAAMPIVFATAFYGLIDLAQLKAGERVLIHAGAGGVGRAAIGIARHIGAEVFATASPAKWEVFQQRAWTRTTSPPLGTSSSKTSSSPQRRARAWTWS